MGKLDRKNGVSIEPSRTCEKRFSQAAALGFYACGHDRKMTEKWDFRVDHARNPARVRAGTRTGKTLPEHGWSL